MTKHYGAKCSTILPGQCAQGWPGWACECDGVNCSEWGVGDFAVWHLTGDELHTALELSKTKFYGKFNKNGYLVLEEVGMLADCGLQAGDVLLYIIEDLPEKEGAYSLKHHKEHVLTWQFTAHELIVMFRREGQADAVVMKNPAYKEVKE